MATILAGKVLSNTTSTSVSDRTAGGVQPDTSPPTGSTAKGSVTNDQLAPMADNTVKANATGASASPQDLAMGASTILARLAAGNIVAATPAQLKVLLDIAFSDLKSGSQIADAQLPDKVSAGSAGDATHVAAVTVDAKGRVTALSSVAINLGGVSATITTAKLTPGGTDGSMTFTNGILTAHTDAT